MSISILLPTQLVLAQSESPDLPVYIVQSGDSINLIAIKFNVSSQDIIDANNITDANLLSIGDQLVIPGIEGVSGVLTTNAVMIGESPDSIARVHQIPIETLYRLNQITSPSQFFIGSNVILVESPESSLRTQILSKGENVLEASIINHLSTWESILSNQTSSPWDLLPSETVVFKTSDKENQVNEIEFLGLPLSQGYTSELNINTLSTPLEASIGLMNLNFFSNGPVQSSLFGIPAMQEPGLYPFHLEYTNNAGQDLVIDQLILIQEGFYPQDPPLYVEASTLDEAITKPEDDLLFSTTAPFTNEKYWTGVFNYPVDEPICIKSSYGNRRSYNDEPYNRFHTGLDFGVCANLNIYAPADGKVVFIDSLTIRGNATIIDHGLGVYSGFWHQSEILVEEGQYVKAGDLIGVIGTTGRSTGPHLHWELIVNGVQVNPLQWLETTYP